MISVHWIPTHRGAEDAVRFAQWNPAFVKIVCIDERPPYLEDIPPSSMIVIRNHPMSELYGVRGFATAQAMSAFVSQSGPTTQQQYEAYFSVAPSSRYADQYQNYLAAWTRGGFVAAGVLSTPTAAGAEHAAVCNRMAQYCESKGVPRSRLLFEGLNEPQLWANETPTMTAEYYATFLNGLHQYGLHGVVGNFGVGWPGNGGVQDAPVQWDFFKPVADLMAPGDFLGLHEYWALNGPTENWRWWAGRFTQCPFKVPILITECGIDTGVTGDWFGGWRKLPYNTVDLQAEYYIDQLWWYALECAKDNRVRGIFPFTWDIGGYEWEKFDNRCDPWWQEFVKQLDAEGMPQPGDAEPPPPPPPIDLNQAIRNAAWGQLGIPYNPTAAFSTYARTHNLGNPVTVEFDVAGYRAQGFAGAIVYAKVGDWANVKPLSW